MKNDVAKKTEYNILVKRVNNTNTTDTSELVKKPDYDTKANEIENRITNHNHDEYINTQEFNKLTSDNFAAKLAQANLASKNDTVNFIKKILMIN